jgi:hypothetical protein
MKMSIARALKEKKRIIGEMNTIHARINDSNVVHVTVKITDGKVPDAAPEEIARCRKFDPNKLLEDWYKLRGKLIAIKTALHKANDEIAEKLITLTELKAELTQIENTPLYDNEKMYANEAYGRITDVVFDRAYYMEKTDKIRAEVNKLQDAIDEYNATHYIEIAD